LLVVANRRGTDPGLAGYLTKGVHP
jgi:hypothetical protein